MTSSTQIASTDAVRLTHKQLKEITGRGQLKGILEWLRGSGLVFRIDSDGWPIVHPQHYAQQMGVIASEKALQEEREEEDRAESARRLSENLRRLAAQWEQARQLRAEKSRLKAERDRLHAEEMKKRAEERQRRREEKERMLAERALSKGRP